MLINFNAPKRLPRPTASTLISLPNQFQAFLCLLLKPWSSICVAQLLLGVGSDLACGDPSRDRMFKEMQSFPQQRSNGNRLCPEIMPTPCLPPCQDLVWLEHAQPCACFRVHVPTELLGLETVSVKLPEVVGMTPSENKVWGDSTHPLHRN